MIKIQDKTKCTGCSACANICPVNCITMQADECGFLYPVADETKCIGCNLCDKTCPVLNNKKIKKENTLAYAAMDLNAEQRLSATSGGVFSLLAEYVLQNHGIVFGVAYDGEWNVRHIEVKEIDELDRLKRAKYAQSVIGETFAQAKVYLDADMQVLFSGTPCQIAGLKAFLKKDYSNLLTVDLVCHSAPSPKAWKTYVEWRKEKDGADTAPSKINQRDKCSGWSKYAYSVNFSYPDGKQYLVHNSQDIYMHTMLSGLTTRPSCTDCHFRGIERCSDITLGDFWGIWDEMPDMDDNKGTSAVIVHTEKGIQSLKAIAGIKIKEIPVEMITKNNQRILSSPLFNKASAEFLKNPNWDSITIPSTDPQAWPTFAARAFNKLKRIAKNF